MLHKSSGFCLFFEERKWKKPVAIFLLLLRRTAPVATKLKYTSHFPRKDWYSACMTCRMRERGKPSFVRRSKKKRLVFFSILDEFIFATPERKLLLSHRNPFFPDGLSKSVPRKNGAHNGALINLGTLSRIRSTQFSGNVGMDGYIIVRGHFEEKRRD